MVVFKVAHYLLFPLLLRFVHLFESLKISSRLWSLHWCGWRAICRRTLRAPIVTPIASNMDVGIVDVYVISKSRELNWREWNRGRQQVVQRQCIGVDHMALGENY